MCGFEVIAGHSEFVDACRPFGDLLSHRGPDMDGQYVSPSGQFGAFHHRLAIVDQTVDSRQPLQSVDGRYVLVFNGEIYNYREIRNQLSSQYDFISSGDSEVLLAAFVVEHFKGIGKLNGMFSAAIWDNDQQELYCFRDRFGVKPLFYSLGQSHVFVASEPKALLRQQRDIRLNPRAAIEFGVANLLHHGRGTFWTNVFRLLPGHMLRYRVQDNSVHVCPWYELPDAIADENEWTTLEAADELHGLLMDSIKVRSDVEVPIGLAFSSGVDSNVILRQFRATWPSRGLHLLTLGYSPDAGFGELASVKALASEFPDFAFSSSVLDCRDVPRLAAEAIAAHDEPFGGIPSLGMMQLFRQARDLGIKVMLDGNGADESLCGYDYYRDQRGSNGEILPVHGLSASSDPGLCRLFDDEVVRGHFAARSDFLGYSAQELHAASPKELQRRDICFTKIPKSCQFRDRESMHSSVEVRSPFLDYRFVEYGMRLPSGLLNGHYGAGKTPLRLIAGRLGFSPKPKLSIPSPQQHWLRGCLRPWLVSTAETALSGSFGEILNRAYLLDLFNKDELEDRQLADLWIAAQLGLLSQLEHARRLST